MTIPDVAGTATMSRRMRRALFAVIGLFPLYRADAQAPAELAWQQFDVDGQHSTVGFTARLLGFIKVRGRFRSYDIAATYDPAHIDHSSVTAVIASKSIDTDMAFRDDHLRSPDFLDAATFPRIEFQSSRIMSIGPGRVRVLGSLSIHGVSHPISFPARITKIPRIGAEGTDGLEMEATLWLSRRAFGIAGTNRFNPSYNPATNLLSDSVEITLELDMHRLEYHDGDLVHLSRALGGGDPPGVVDTIARTLESSGATAAVELYRQLRSTQPKAFNFGPGQLDRLGQVLVARKRMSDALVIFRLNADANPASDLALEGLAQALATAGDGPGALAVFRTASSVEPLSASAREMIRRLGGPPA